MKKSLIALAVLAASGAAMAQSSVTLYGVADIGFASENNGTTTTSRLDSGNLNGSRWGLKGTEDLGGGLKALFVLEAGLSLDTGAQSSTTSLFNRQSYVGVSGGFGAVKLGRQVNPVYNNSGTFDPFGDALAGDTARLLNYQGSRTDNAVTYAYAADGFRGEAQYGLGEVAGNNSLTGANSKGRTLAALVGYKNGPIDVVLTHQNTHNAAGTGATKVTLLGGNYDFGVAKAFLTFDSEKASPVFVTAAIPNTTDARNTVIGAKVPVGAGTVIVSYINHQNKAVTNADAHQFAVGYTYDLSKRTALYTSYGRLTNDTNSAIKAAAGKTDTLFNAGVRHSF